MRYVATNLSKEAGRMHRWRGPLLQRRYQAILVSEEELAQIGRLRHLLAHGVKESLVARVVHWPGAHCAAALMAGEAPVGIWYDRGQQHAARHRGEDVTDTDFATTYRLELQPLPCWRHLRADEVCRRIGEMVAEIETEAATRHRRERTAPLGAKGVLRQAPHDGPSQSKRSPAPLVHAASKRVRLELREVYYAVVAAFREAAEKLRSGCRDVAFPEGSFPPSLPFCRSG
jgi:hypothetical protein